MAIATEFSCAIATAWSRSHYRCLSDNARQRLLASAEEVHLAAGRHLPVTPRSSQAGLVIDGLFRVYAGSGVRQVTLQYAAEGDAFGVPDLRPSSSGAGLSAGGQAVVDSHLLMLNRDELAVLLRTDPTVSRAVIDGLLVAHVSSVSLLAENVLSPLRRRVARHLLDLALRENGAVMVHATVQDLANATGTVREVVTRLLKDLRTDGLVSRRGSALVLHDLRRLHRIARGDEDNVSK
ncbi:Crp/Fnr family transcriptional regulator [Amycolatopsis deserti]|uniref:Crp/Fnr family transcriptional regulator n=2 Tax=Amycolatopsis deserti TaxID=185696 RepID=A0ABQ3IDN8_9PSEU|nr:Crp/Fnr family transcriptional regulator [Amycolatopsis deserti]